jgi:hypothetical protein
MATTFTYLLLSSIWTSCMALLPARLFGCSADRVGAMLLMGLSVSC